jgi:2-oxoglutarate ferredoxin oxidoreductase subunit delta
LTGTADREAERRALDDKLTWAGDYCKHCFLCINICPVKNLRFENDEMVSEGKCIQCELCQKYCPDFTIEVKPKERKPKPADKTEKPVSEVKAADKGAVKRARSKAAVDTAEQKAEPAARSKAAVKNEGQGTAEKAAAGPKAKPKAVSKKELKTK